MHKAVGYNMGQHDMPTIYAQMDHAYITSDTAC